MLIQPMPYVYDDGGRESSGRRGQTGDCVCRAVAIASGRPYGEIYEALARGNATERRTRQSAKLSGKHTAAEGIHTKRKWYKDFIKSLGFVWVPCMGIGTGCRVHLAAGELPRGRLVVHVSGHSVAVIDGTIHDIYNPSREHGRCVYGYWMLN